MSNMIYGSLSFPLFQSIIAALICRCVIVTLLLRRVVYKSSFFISQVMAKPLEAGGLATNDHLGNIILVENKQVPPITTQVIVQKVEAAAKEEAVDEGVCDKKPALSDDVLLSDLQLAEESAFEYSRFVCVDCTCVFVCVLGMLHL